MENAIETVKEALATLSLNKLRTGLAMLGIVIGIGSVIALLSLGQATQKQIESNIQSLGANLLTVSPGFQTQGAVRGAAGGGTTLTNEDAQAIAESPSITTINNVSPELSSRSQVTSRRNNTNVQIIGATPAYTSVHNLEIEQGSFITDTHVSSRSRVAVLGPQVVTDLFGENANPIGQTIRISGQSLMVIGTTVSKGGTGFMNQDNIIYVPLSTAQKQLFGQDYLSSIAVEAKSADVMTQTQNEIGYLLFSPP